MPETRFTKMLTLAFLSQTVRMLATLPTGRSAYSGRAPVSYPAQCTTRFPFVKGKISGNYFHGNTAKDVLGKPRAE
jgi:hypothetical protein